MNRVRNFSADGSDNQSQQHQLSFSENSEGSGHRRLISDPLATSYDAGENDDSDNEEELADGEEELAEGEKEFSGETPKYDLLNEDKAAESSEKDHAMLQEEDRERLFLGDRTREDVDRMQEPSSMPLGGPQYLDEYRAENHAPFSDGHQTSAHANHPRGEPERRGREQQESFQLEQESFQLEHQMLPEGRQGQTPHQQHPRMTKAFSLPRGQVADSHRQFRSHRSESNTSSPTTPHAQSELVAPVYPQKSRGAEREGLQRHHGRQQWDGGRMQGHRGNEESGSGFKSHDHQQQQQVRSN